MSERSKRNVRKPVKYDFDDHSDDDFVPSAPRAKSEKSKASTKEKPAVKRAKSEITTSSPKVSLQRMKVEDRVFERELEMAMELSKKADDSQFKISPSEISTVSMQETVVIDADSDSGDAGLEILENETASKSAEGNASIPEGVEDEKVPSVGVTEIKAKTARNGEGLVSERKSSGLMGVKSDASDGDDESFVGASKKNSKRLKVESDDDSLKEEELQVKSEGRVTKTTSSDKVPKGKSKASDDKLSDEDDESYTRGSKKSSKKVKAAAKSDSEFDDSDEVSDTGDDSDFDGDFKGKKSKTNSSKKNEKMVIKESKSLKKTDSAKVPSSKLDSAAKAKRGGEETKPVVTTKKSGRSSLSSTVKSTTASLSAAQSGSPSISSPLAASLLNKAPLPASRLGIRVGLSRSARVKPLHPSLHEKF